MNPAETPIEALRSLRPKPETRTGTRPEPERSKEEFEPRYVEVPRRRRAQLTAERNLKWGLVLFLVSLGLLGAGLIVRGSQALVPLAICLVTFTTLWAMARLHVFHQRNGVFFAAAIICLLGAFIPLIERGYSELDRMVHNPGPDSPQVVTDSGVKAADAAFLLDQTPDSDPPSLVEAFKVKPPTAATDTVRVIGDTRIMVGRKPYLLRAGDTFAIDDIKDGQVSIVANELRVFVPEDAVDLLPPKRPESAVVNRTARSAPPIVAEPPAQPRVSDQEPVADVTARAQSEAVRRYPGIGIKDSPENVLFLERFRALKVERPELFEEPEWPIYLAEGLAKEQGWQRAGEGVRPGGNAEE